jgi:Arc/MetJ family transcription regulator
MTKRTTIEIDDKLLARAKRALGSTTTRGTVEEALRRVADAAEAAGADRAARQQAVLSRLQAHIDGGVLTSEDMWR